MHRFALWLILLSVMVLSYGCDNYSKLNVECQMGMINPSNGHQNADVFRCEFVNLSKSVTRSCIRVSVKDGANTFTSEPVCSGWIYPDSDRDGVRDNSDDCPLTGAFEKNEAGEVITYNIGKDGCRQRSEKKGEEVANQNRVGHYTTDVFDAKTRQAILKTCVSHGAKGKPIFNCAIDIEELPL